MRKIIVKTDIKVPETIKERREFLKKRLKKFQGKKYTCPALSNADVYVIGHSIKETVFQASKSKKSTVASLYLDKIIKSSVFISKGSPKKGTQNKKFNFKEVFVLYTEIQGLGTVKLVVGVNNNDDYLQYCVTAIE